MKIPCKPLSDILDVLKSMSIDTVTIVPAPEGWEFYVRDPSNFMMVSAILKKDAFEENEYDPEMEPFAVNYEFLRDSIAKRDSLDLTVEDGFVKVTAGNTKAKKRLYSLDETPRIMPKIKLKNSVAFTSDVLIELASKKYWSGASGCELGLQVDTSETEIKFSFESENEGYTDTYPVPLADMPDGPQKSHFSPTFLLPVLKALPKGVAAIFTMETDKPLIVTLTTDEYKIDIFIAPRIGD